MNLWPVLNFLVGIWMGVDAFINIQQEDWAWAFAFAMLSLVNFLVFVINMRADSHGR